MAEESIIQKKFNISFGELALFANTIVMAMNRDIAEMADYGVTAETISDFQDTIDDFQNLPDDEILRTDLSYAIEQRDIKKEAVLKTIRSILLQGLRRCLAKTLLSIVRWHLVLFRK